MKIITLSLFTGFLFISCSFFPAPDRRVGLLYKDILVYNTFRDTCMIFRDEAGDTIRFHRRFRILENTFTDTMNVALELIDPGQKREIFCKQMGTATNGGMDNSPEYEDYLERRNKPELYTEYLCMYHRPYWRKINPGAPKGKEKEYMKIRIWYKSKV